ncbi:hypothetical protein ACVISU_001866 [Bradyrhizobium sp. USDA 4452]
MSRHHLRACAGAASLAMPKSAATGRQYSGIKVLTATERAFTGQSWLTFRQALSFRGHVRKGERGTTVVYADRFVPVDEKRRASETVDDAQAIPLLKRFTVFNIDQCDGLPSEIAVTAPPPPSGLIAPDVEYLIKASGIDFRICGNRAFYVPAEDYRCRHRKPISSRSTGIERPCTSWRMPAAMHRVSTASLASKGRGLSPPFRYQLRSNCSLRSGNRRPQSRDMVHRPLPPYPH